MKKNRNWYWLIIGALIGLAVILLLQKCSIEKKLDKCTKIEVVTRIKYDTIEKIVVQRVKEQVPVYVHKVIEDKEAQRTIDSLEADNKQKLLIIEGYKEQLAQTGEIKFEEKLFELQDSLIDEQIKIRYKILAKGSILQTAHQYEIINKTTETKKTIPVEQEKETKTKIGLELKSAYAENIFRPMIGVDVSKGWIGATVDVILPIQGTKLIPSAGVRLNFEF